MDSSEGISEFLNQLASKRKSFLKSLLTLMLESKDLDKHLHSTKECLNECVIDLKSKRENLESDPDSLLESNRELDAFRESLVSRMKEIECGEEKLRSFEQTQLEEVKVKEGQMAEIRMWVVGKMQEVELKEERLSEQKKSFEVLLAKFQEEEKEFEVIQESVSKNLNLVSLKERNIEDRSKELIIVRDSIERRAKELYSEEEKVEMIEQQLDCARKLIEERSDRLDSKEKQLNSVQEYLQKSFSDFHAGNRQLKNVQELLEKQLEDQSKFFEGKEKQLEEQFNKFELTKKQLEERCRDLEWKEKQLQELKKYFELKKKHLEDFESKGKQIEEQSKQIVLEAKKFGNVVDFLGKVGQVEDITALELPTEIDSMDGRCLQLYLNENFKDYESSSSDMCRILRLLSNPPRVVLDAIEGFYPPHMMKEDVVFETSVVRRSCTLLLEQLMRLSTKIRPNVKKRALTLAGEWKVKMEVFPRNPLEVLAFILLLASYNLASNFDADEVLQLLKFVKPNQVPEFCRFLGLQEKVPDFIRRLVERRCHLEAIEYVCAFNITDEFPLTTLLDGHISYEEEAAGKILEEGLYCVEAREIACRKELNALKAAMSCITLHELESQYPVGDIKVRIEQLKNRWIHLQNLALCSSPKARLTERFDSPTEERDSKRHKGQHMSTVSPLQSPPYLISQTTESQYPPGFFGCNNFSSPSNFAARSCAKSEVHFRQLWP